MASIWNPSGGSGGGIAVPETGCSVILIAQQSVGTSENKLIAWDSASGARCYNTGTVWSEANKTRFTATEAGLYTLVSTLWWDAESSTGERALHVTLEGGNKKHLADENHAINSTNGRIEQVFWQGRLALSEWIAIEAFQDSGTTRKVEADAFGTGFPTARATFERIR